jgi:hypothetical protein
MLGLLGLACDACIATRRRNFAYRLPFLANRRADCRRDVSAICDQACCQ